MAIFGTLDQLPLPEVLSLLKNRVGILRLKDYENQSNYELILENGVIREAYYGTSRITSMQDCIKHLQIIAKAKNGRFQFERQSPCCEGES